MIKGFRVLGWLEGISLLVLLFIAMPMKYVMGQPEMVRMVGQAHGMLFLLYVVMAVNLAISHDWKKMKLLMAVILSSVPFGTFFFEKKYL
ncbi:DUF3817 domain-containing protein [Bdellovibrio svalbardensis]|uniref:DUF3817 domain-containing protein n=1 Tax=Bdellovibrio svalbardensis TaxID=2972972 RepID=A0ABT6DEA3_9BACT|nr:DUF3817 domain-containing protein [Bdellovibrio svalbardensis]MDG0815171.1 DUF3817 domain-containing protein [Bdellovibrio svalbardensis]